MAHINRHLSCYSTNEYVGVYCFDMGKILSRVPLLHKRTISVCVDGCLLWLGYWLKQPYDDFHCVGFRDCPDSQESNPELYRLAYHINQYQLYCKSTIARHGETLCFLLTY